MNPLLAATPRQIETALGRMECAVEGSGPALLALHGAMGGYDQGLLLARSVAGCIPCRFIAPSRPGYLGTPLALGREPAAQADLCAALLDALGVPDAVVVAVSGGGQCALQFALRHALRCRALVLISACSAPILKRPPLRFYLMMLMARFPSLVEAMMRKAAADPEARDRRSIPDDELRARTLSDPEAGPLLRALQQSTGTDVPRRLDGTRNDVRASRSRFAYPFEEITAPTLVVHGTEDEAAPFAQAPALAARVPGAELLAIEGGRHTALFTHLAEIRRRAEKYVRA